jgi:hypothetical protein
MLQMALFILNVVCLFCASREEFLMFEPKLTLTSRENKSISLHLSFVPIEEAETAQGLNPMICINLLKGNPGRKT